jgi:hypothetical protein
MELLLSRDYKKDKYTIGRLYINGKFFCNTIEDKDRNLNSSMSESQIKGLKVYGETAIPIGTYIIDMNTVSPKFSKYSFYLKTCSGKVPRLQNVKGFDGILIHVADGPKGATLIQGCIGVGYNTIKGGLTEGKKVFTELYKQLLQDKLQGEKIIITIK